jgi:hypothetical protein
MTRIKNNVKVLVLEKFSYDEGVKVLELMPRLEWIHSQFRKTEEFGIYEINAMIKLLTGVMPSQRHQQEMILRRL